MGVVMSMVDVRDCCGQVADAARVVRRRGVRPGEGQGGTIGIRQAQALRWAVVEFFRRNEEEELLIADVAQKFEGLLEHRLASGYSVWRALAPFFRSQKLRWDAETDLVLPGPALWDGNARGWVDEVVRP